MQNRSKRRSRSKRQGLSKRQSLSKRRSIKNRRHSIKSKRRSIKNRRHSIKRKYSNNRRSHLRGGEGVANNAASTNTNATNENPSGATVPQQTVQPTPGPSQVGANNNAQNSGNNKLSGGGGRRKIKKQRGGSSWLDKLYAYTPPPGMMGPVPQPSQSPASNGLILNAAQITVAGQANAQFDGNVCPTRNPNA
jgi:hypothetical protein